MKFHLLLFSQESINTHRVSANFKPCQVKRNSTTQKQSPDPQQPLQRPSTTSTDLQLPLFVSLPTEDLQIPLEKMTHDYTFSLLVL